MSTPAPRCSHDCHSAPPTAKTLHISGSLMQATEIHKHARLSIMITTEWQPECQIIPPSHYTLQTVLRKKPCSQLVTTVQKLSDLVIFRNTYTHHHCNLVLQRETSVESLLIVIMTNDNHLWGKITAWNHCLSVSIPCWNSKYQKGDITCQHNDYTAMCC